MLEVRVQQKAGGTSDRIGEDQQPHQGESYHRQGATAVENEFIEFKSRELQGVFQPPDECCELQLSCGSLFCSKYGVLAATGASTGLPIRRQPNTMSQAGQRLAAISSRSFRF